MNWEKINKKYPKASDKFLEFIGFEGTTEKDRDYLFTHFDEEITGKMNFNLRDLYTFFDNYGVIVLIHDIFMWAIFYYLENRDDYYFLENEKWFDTRKEAEESAFKKAFEFLDNMLKNTKNAKIKN